MYGKQIINMNPELLVSYINTKLRDYYQDLDDLCEDLDIDKDELINILNKIGYFYFERLNQFVHKNSII